MEDNRSPNQHEETRNTGHGEHNHGNNSTENNLYSCNICFETASEPVITFCGHLFDWPCIYRWLEMHPPGESSCPVCKAGLTKEKLIPVFGPGVERRDPRETIPERPRAQPPPPPQHNQQGFRQTPFGWQYQRNGFQTQVYYGPGLFSMLFGGQNLFPPQMYRETGLHDPQQPQQPGDQEISRLFLFIGLFVLFMLVSI
eukprot:TRINITY_DN6813_c0_g1_i5.p1 TRINITY_DN6813_c0_g1~~TRINITY_DN6813_c0_g1_i5.p1  ORF type:complete len:199 (+),score=32.87 TRINITY_DN6813_c0_g1_i5:42-638(+)